MMGNEWRQPDQPLGPRMRQLMSSEFVGTTITGTATGVGYVNPRRR